MAKVQMVEKEDSWYIPQKAPKRATRQARNRMSFLLYCGPALVLFILVMGWPLVNMFQVSFLDWRGLAAPSKFIGLANYQTLFSSPKFFEALRNTTLYCIALEAVVLPTSFMLGFFLSQFYHGYRIFRTIFFSPTMLSAPALAMIFFGIFIPDGFLNFLLKSIGLESLTRVWLANAQTSLGAMVAVDCWGAIGFFSVLFFASLANLPQELLEAARIDGAGTGTVIWRIALPMCIDMFGLSAVLMFIGSFTQAQNVLLLTKGGPGTSSLTTGYYLYQQAFEVQKLGYSQAIGVLIMVVGVTGTIVLRRFFRPRY